MRYRYMGCVPLSCLPENFLEEGGEVKLQNQGQVDSQAETWHAAPFFHKLNPAEGDVDQFSQPLLGQAFGLAGVHKEQGKDVTDGGFGDKRRM